MSRLIQSTFQCNTFHLILFHCELHPELKHIRELVYSIEIVFHLNRHHKVAAVNFGVGDVFTNLCPLIVKENSRRVAFSTCKDDRWPAKDHELGSADKDIISESIEYLKSNLLFF